MTGWKFRLLQGVAFACLLITNTSVRGQSPDEMFTQYRRAYHDESAVYIRKNAVVTIERAGQALVASRQIEEDRITLKILAGETANEQVGYSGLVQLKRIGAYTRTPVKDRYRKEEVTRFVHKDDRDQRIFHDDARSVNFLYPAVLPGSITHLDYELTYADTRLVNGFFFAASVPVEESMLTVIHGKDVAVDVRRFHIPEGALITTTEEKHGRITETYAMRNVAKLVFEPDGPNIRYYAPHIQLVVRDLKPSPAEAGKSDLARLYHWYYGNVAPVSSTDAPELSRIADQVTAGSADDMEKAERLFAWVQDNIKYIAVEDGMNGFVPAPAAKVCRDRYGDCKAMANLLRALLVNAGLDAHLAWTGSREIPYTYEELPSTAADDHMIVVLRMADRDIILDATSDQCPFGMPSFYIQGKQVLMAIDSTTYELIRAPIIPATANTLLDSVRVHIDGADLVGSGTMRLTGQERANMATMLNWLQKDKWPEELMSRHMKYNNRYRPDSITVTGREDRNAEMILHYRFRIPGIVTNSGSEQFLSLDLEFPWRDKKYALNRKIPVQLDFASTETYVTVLEPVPGSLVSHVPDDTRKDHPSFGYSCNYDITPGGQVTCTTVYRTGFIQLPADLVAEWTGAVNAREQELNRSVVLTTSP
ncbi:MAG: transglutaminase domain-containing protein [Flavobacteriales bacterium]